MISLETLALTVAIAILVKIIIVIISPKSWLKVVDKIYSRSWLMMIISFFLGLAVLQLLLDNGMTIIQIFAVMLFLILISAMTLAVYSREMLDLGGKLLRDKSILKKAWFPILIWTLLGIWVLYSVFV